MRYGGFALVAMCGVSTVVAQTDPAVAVREVAQRIEQEMQEIDRLLRASPDAENSLDLAQWQQRNVVQDIDRLLEELHEFCCTCPGGT